MKITSQNRTSDSYRFTVKMIDGKVAPEDQRIVEELKALIKESNKVRAGYSNMFGSSSIYKPRRVKLQGRGPRPSRRFHQSLPLSMATHADVYVYDRT